MEGERGVLQDGIEAVAFGRRRAKPRERVRRQQNEQQERERDRALHRQHARAQPLGRLPPNSATAAPKMARISTHSSIEPSWFPHVPEIL